MSLVVDLPSDLEAKLATEAARVGLPLSEYVVRLLAEDRTTNPAPRTGAELVAYWQAEGLIGTRPDITDGPAHARQLRDQAQTRTRP
jgi:hypothetical protein